MAWEVKGDLSETLFEDTWVCTAYDLLTGAIVGEVTSTGSDFTIPVPSADPVKVTVEPRRFDIWRGSSTVALNQRVYPTDPEATPYYYRCSTAGITGQSEPVWQITPSATIIDGSAVWVLVEKVIKPTTHIPVIPTPV